MDCPKCSNKTTTVDNSFNEKENELYRKKKCKSCGHIFYSVEYPVILNKKFKKEWLANHRSSNSFDKIWYNEQ